MECVFENKDCISPVKAIPSIKIFGKDNHENGRTPYLTIAIPTYKRTILLADALDSALKQEDYYDYEVVVVDNNPDRGDETEMYMQQYAEHPRVSYYKNSENVGMAGNWNKCLLLSKSNYVVLLHDDDVIFPFALKYFSRVIERIKGPWSLVKPELQKFSSKDDLYPQSGNHYTLRKLTKFNFSYDCPVGAPTCILFNRASYLNVGGANADYYPCIDYSLHLRLSCNSSSYLLYNGECFGGYRVANNESLSESTMDNYFLLRNKISESVMKSLHIPLFIRQRIQAAKIDDQINMVLSYYNMNNYRFKYDKYDLIDIKPSTKTIINKIYNFTMRVNNLFNRKSINF